MTLIEISEADHGQAAHTPNGTMPVWLTVLTLLAAMISVVAGIPYWAINGWLLGVVLSATVPGFRAVSILVSLFA